MPTTARYIPRLFVLVAFLVARVVGACKRDRNE
jgi:hypothetical protein